MNATPRKLFAVLAALALVAVATAPAATAAGKRTIKDARFDNRAVSENGRIDIVKVVASRRGDEARFAITMRAKLKPGRSKERPGLFLNTKGKKRSAPEYVIFGSTLFKVRNNGTAKAIGQASLSESKRTWRYSFDTGQVDAIADGYGWAAVTQKGNDVADIAPDEGYVKFK